MYVTIIINDLFFKVKPSKETLDILSRISPNTIQNGTKHNLDYHSRGKVRNLPLL